MRLFPPTVVLEASSVPGNPADLFESEAHYVVNARPKRINEFAAGRRCARAALAQFGVSDVALQPAADRQPIWPAGFVGSITHTHGFCAAAVASRATTLALGLDSEVVGAPTHDVWPSICRDEELAWLDTLPVTERGAAITVIFSAKEAFYKCQYPLIGEWLDFHDVHIDVPCWGLDAGTFQTTATRPIGFATRVPAPVTGRYAFHGEYVSTGVWVPASAPR